MRTEELIARLAAEATPVRRLARGRTRLARWLAVSIGAIAIGVALFTPRPDVQSRLGDTAYLTLLALTAATAVFAAAHALDAAVPDDRPRGWWTALPLVTAAGWLAVLLARLATAGPIGSQLLAEPGHVGCLGQIAALAAVPAGLLFVMLRRAAPLERTRTAALAALAAVAAGAAGSQIVCPIDSVAHQVIWHFTAAMALAGAGGVAGRPALDRLTR